MATPITVLLDEYADIREALTGNRWLHRLVGEGFDAWARRGFIDLYDALIEVEQRFAKKEREDNVGLST